MTYSSYKFGELIFWSLQGYALLRDTKVSAALVRLDDPCITPGVKRSRYLLWKQHQQFTEMVQGL